MRFIQLKISHFTIGVNDEFLQMMDENFSTYQHVDCLYTLLNYRFRGKTVAKTGQLFDKVQRAVYFGQKAEECTECPAWLEWKKDS